MHRIHKLETQNICNRELAVIASRGLDIRTATVVDLLDDMDRVEEGVRGDGRTEGDRLSSYRSIVKDGQYDCWSAGAHERSSD